jgi:hypothetical protein
MIASLVPHVTIGVPDPVTGTISTGHTTRTAAARGSRMTHRDEATATDRLRRGLLAFQTAHTHTLAAHRRLKDLPQAEVEVFWNRPGQRIEANMGASAAEVLAAFKAFSAAGLVADVTDRHLVTAAQRHLAESAA